MSSNNKKNDLKKLLTTKEKQLEADGFISFAHSELQKLTKKDAETFEKHFHGRAMMELPLVEIAFFNWLKENDRPVWDDLWKNVDEPYRVSLDFLHHFVEYGNGFPICDLIGVDNYWFHTRHIKPKAFERMEEIQQKLPKKEALSFEEGILIEIARGSIDLWHFCYRYKLPLSVAKRKIEIMHREDLLVHLRNREDLVKYLDI